MAEAGDCPEGVLQASLGSGYRPTVRHRVSASPGGRRRTPRTEPASRHLALRMLPDRRPLLRIAPNFPEEEVRQGASTPVAAVAAVRSHSGYRMPGSSSRPLLAGDGPYCAVHLAIAPPICNTLQSSGITQYSPRHAPRTRWKYCVRNLSDEAGPACRSGSRRTRKTRTRVGGRAQAPQADVGQWFKPFCGKRRAGCAIRLLCVDCLKSRHGRGRKRCLRVLRHRRSLRQSVRVVRQSLDRATMF